MNTTYNRAVDSIIIEAIKFTEDFYEIVLMAKGMHPIEIVHSLNRLHKDGLIDNAMFNLVTQSISSLPRTQEDGYEKILPVPHQMDYDWRFSNNGKQFFIDYINHEIKEKQIKRIAFIGSPSLFRHYCEHGRREIEYYLIDFNANKHIQNIVLSANSHVINCNLNYDLDMELSIDQLNVDLIITDPPWYLEYYMQFFQICSVIGNDRSTVIGVFPSLFTRESVFDERNSINSYVNKLGFRNLSYKPLCIEYYTPPFEQNVLKVNGIVNYPICWRKGDFFSTTRSYKSDAQCNNDVVIRNGFWTEKTIQNVRFKIRQSTFTEDVDYAIRLERLYPNDIYPSVSRRYKGHDKINVWTSGNRVLYCSNVSILFVIFENIYVDDIIRYIENEYGEVLPDSQRLQIQEAQYYLRNIIDMELNEYGLWKK